MTDRDVNAPERVRALVEMFTNTPVPTLIRNLETKMQEVDAAGLSWPVTINDGPETCYICCPTTAYIDYALEETRHFVRNPILKTLLTGLIRACQPLVRASGLDRQAQINNWLFSTNPVPVLDERQAIELRDTCLTVFPKRALVMRSLNDLADRQTLNALRAAGFALLPARQVYVWEPKHGSREKINARRDAKLLRATHLLHVTGDQFDDMDFDRAAELYGMLYLDKYTPLNPHYTGDYIRKMHRAGLLQIEGFRDPDTTELVAATGYFQNGRTLTQPLVGYDTALPVELGLYRLLMASSQAYARVNGLFFNMSAGAAEFKRLRGARPAIEYTAVYVKHMPQAQRLSVAIMSMVLNRIGVPILKRFQL
jgi:hypothetical protein